MANLEPLSTLAAKSPQNPSTTSSAQRTQPSQVSASTFSGTEKQTTSSQRLTRPVLSTTTSSNYAQALEDAAAARNSTDSGSNTVGDWSGQNTTKGATSPGSKKVDTDKTLPRDGIRSPSSATWRPKFDRQQSWSEQDRKRAMQEDLMSPVTEKEMGFSSAKDGKTA